MTKPDTQLGRMANQTKKSLKKKEGEHNEKIRYTAHFDGLIDLVEENEGQVVFLIKVNDQITTISTWDISGEQYLPPPKEHLPFLLPRASEVLEYYSTDNDKQLFNDLIAYFKRFAFLPEEYWVLIACIVFLSYQQDNTNIHYLPYLLFFAVPERGKSRTGKAIVCVAYRGVHTPELREANVFRYSENLKATIFFDIMDLWKKAEKSGCTDILLLRFERGSKVSRVLYPDRGAFRDTQFYDVFGSTIIATNQPLHKILDTRCLPINMPNAPSNDYENVSPEKGLCLKERMTAWRARNYQTQLPNVEAIPEIKGRLWDISKPVLQVCKLVIPEHLQALIDVLKEIAGQVKEDKKATFEGQILSVLNDLSENGLMEWSIKTQVLLDRLNETRPEQFKLTSQGLGKRLKAMGLHTRLVHGYSEIVIKRDTFDVLLKQYGLLSPPILCKNYLPNSTNHEKHEASPDNAGIESIGPIENDIEALLAKIPDARVSLVESGGELDRSRGENTFEEEKEGGEH